MTISSEIRAGFSDVFVEIEKHPQSRQLHENVCVRNGKNVDDAQNEHQLKEYAVEDVHFSTFEQNYEHKEVEWQGDARGHSR